MPKSGTLGLTEAPNLTGEADARQNVAAVVFMLF